jgi:hypothetical protein
MSLMLKKYTIEINEKYLAEGEKICVEATFTQHAGVYGHNVTVNVFITADKNFTISQIEKLALDEIRKILPSA